MRRATKAATLILAFIALATVVPQVAQARGIRAHCGEHWGTLYRIDAGGARYHVRFGPRPGHRGGTMHCHGLVWLRNARARTGGSWHAFNWPGWHTNQIIAVNSVAATCAGFGVALAGEAPTGAMDSWLTASGGIGCLGASTAILSRFIGGAPKARYCKATAGHPICNARVGMR